MSLRLKLLLVALSTLALPWAGWQFVKQTEALLRQGQEQALLASAGMLAKALEARRVEPPPAGPVLYVQRADEPITVDGYADDWAALRPYAQALGPPGDAQKLRALLARRGGELYLLAEVRDATRARADARDPRVSISDYVDLTLTQDGQSGRYRLASAAPGGFSSALVPERDESKSGHPSPHSSTEADGQLPEFLSGAWQEDGSGYRIELKLPHGVVPQRLGLAVHDSAVADSTPAPEPRALLGYDEEAARALRPLVPEHSRARLIAADGWLLADAGRVDAPAAPRTDEAGWLAGLIYRGLIAPPPGGSTQLGGDMPRLDAPEVWQALSGVPATSWRSAYSGVVVLTAAVPLGGSAGTRGALVLEQASRALPLLANRALVGLAVATLAALAIAGAILLVFGASLSFRIRRLRNAAERAVRTSGHLEGPMPLADSPDELGDLARSFRKLLDEVGAYTDYLRTLASKLSHELNTPLAIVKSSLDNLEHQALPPEARSYLSRARDGADRLGAIVRAMSEANRIERAIAAADAEDFDLRALVAGCAESYRVLAAPRALRLDLPVAAVPFHGAPELIAQALDKLFDNACSFAPPDGWIALSLVRAENGGATIRVANSGPVLPAAMQERLFDSLVSVRERGARAGETPHLGLGLYVVRLVTELHRGTAAAGNLAEGSGVQFSLVMQGMPRRRLSEGGDDA